MKGGEHHASNRHARRTEARKLLKEYRDSINRHPDNKTQNKGNSERLTRRTINKLMDVHRDTYHKVRGRVKRK